MLKEINNICKSIKWRVTLVVLDMKGLNYNGGDQALGQRNIVQGTVTDDNGVSKIAFMENGVVIEPMTGDAQRYLRELNNDIVRHEQSNI